MSEQPAAAAKLVVCPSCGAAVPSDSMISSARFHLHNQQCLESEGTAAPQDGQTTSFAAAAGCSLIARPPM